MQRIVKGDFVRVISGKFKNQEGSVLAVYPKINKILIESVNKIKRHTKANQKNSEGGIIEKEALVDWSKVTLVNGKSKQVYTKIAYIFDKNNKKIRVDKKTQLPVVKHK